MVRITAIVPATNRPLTLPACIDSIRRAADPPEELIVVEEPSALGAAEARNVGASSASGDILVFVDADVAVHKDAFTRIRANFDSEPTLTAVFGSYDDVPAGPDVVSGFRNLLHHYVHHESPGAAKTFWTGVGAVRRDAFASVGGFDARLQWLEDVDLGVRLDAKGERIVLDPTIQGTHLKRWTLRTMLWTDFVGRGIPWTVLLLRHRASATTLNLGWRHRLSATSCLIGCAAVVMRRPWVAAASLGALVVLNRSFYLLLLRKRGPRQAALGVGLHTLHHLTGIAAVPAGAIAFLFEQRSATRRSEVS
jgi:GT2 family glycosyltransferase